FIGYSGDSTAAVYAINTGAFDTLQTSLSILDQEAIDLLLPLARAKNMGVIAKRPIGNAVWRHETKPENPYVQPYWDRLQKLGYAFINGDAEKSTDKALRFTLSAEGVHCAIVGTKKPGRWQQNAKLLEQGKLGKDEYEAIRKIWKATAQPDWVGQV